MISNPMSIFTGSVNGQHFAYCYPFVVGLLNFVAVFTLKERRHVCARQAYSQGHAVAAGDAVRIDT